MERKLKSLLAINGKTNPIGNGTLIEQIFWNKSAGIAKL